MTTIRQPPPLLRLSSGAGAEARRRRTDSSSSRRFRSLSRPRRQRPSVVGSDRSPAPRRTDPSAPPWPPPPSRKRKAACVRPSPRRRRRPRTQTRSSLSPQRRRMGSLSPSTPSRRTASPYSSPLQLCPSPRPLPRRQRWQWRSRATTPQLRAAYPSSSDGGGSGGPRRRSPPKRSLWSRPRPRGGGLRGPLSPTITAEAIGAVFPPPPCVPPPPPARGFSSPSRGGGGLPAEARTFRCSRRSSRVHSGAWLDLKVPCFQLLLCYEFNPFPPGAPFGAPFSFRAIKS